MEYIPSNEIDKLANISFAIIFVSILPDASLDLKILSELLGSIERNIHYRHTDVPHTQSTMIPDPTNDVIK